MRISDWSSDVCSSDLSNTGLPLYTDEEVYLGSYQPDYTASFGTNLNYKGIGFNILFDLKQGGNFVSQTKFMTELDRKSVVKGKSVSVRVDLGGGCINKKQKTKTKIEVRKRLQR